MLDANVDKLDLESGIRIKICRGNQHKESKPNFGVFPIASAMVTPSIPNFLRKDFHDKAFEVRVLKYFL